MTLPLPRASPRPRPFSEPWDCDPLPAPSRIPGHRAVGGRGPGAAPPPRCAAGTGLCLSSAVPGTQQCFNPRVAGLNDWTVIWVGTWRKNILFKNPLLCSGETSGTCRTQWVILADRERFHVGYVARHKAACGRRCWPSRGWLSASRPLCGSEQWEGRGRGEQASILTARTVTHRKGFTAFLFDFLFFCFFLG